MRMGCWTCEARVYSNDACCMFYALWSSSSGLPDKLATISYNIPNTTAAACQKSIF